MAEEFPVYEVRRGWTSQTILSAAIVGPIVVALAVFFIVIHAWLGLVTPAFFAVGLFGIVDGGVRKPVALRMDGHGITLTKGLSRTPTLLVPWPEVHAVWLVRKTRRFNAIGVTTTSARDEPRRTFGMINWQADADRIAEILARYAPTATLIDRTSAPQHAGGDAPETSGPGTASPGLWTSAIEPVTEQRGE